MIDQKELRIGNLVYYKYLRSAPDKWVYGEAVISGIHENGFQFKKITGNHSLVVDLKDFDPIHIKPEWLERLGFETKTGYVIMGRIDLSGITWMDVINDGTAEVCGQWNESVAVSPCKFIHQLQNLYFALTGNELTIK